MDANTNRGDPSIDPLDQGHLISNSIDERKHKVAQGSTIDIESSGALNGNIYNVTNTINVHMG